MPLHRKDQRPRQRKTPYRRDTANKDLSLRMSHLQEQQDRTRTELMDMAKRTEIHASSPAVLGDSDSDSDDEEYDNGPVESSSPYLFSIKENAAEESSDPEINTKEVDDIDAKDAAEKETLLSKPATLELPPPDHESTRSGEDSDKQLSPEEKEKSSLDEVVEEAEEEADAEPASWGVHGVFCQLDVLCHFEDGDYGWKESARWMKYEEKVELGERWSKPHVASTSLHALQELRKGLEQHTIILDLNAPHGCSYQVAEVIADAILKETNFTPDVGRKIVEVFLKPHKHQHRGGLRKGDLALSAAEAEKRGIQPRHRLPYKGPEEDTHEHSKYRFNDGLAAKTLMPYKPNKKLMQKIPKGTEAANILIGQVDFLLRPVMVFARLVESLKLADMSEVALPTRFIFLMLGPHGCSEFGEYEETGRAMALLLTDRVFCEVAYKAETREELLDGIDELIDDLAVLPPSIWDPETRLDPPDKPSKQETIRAQVRGHEHHITMRNIDAQEIHGHSETGLQRSGKPFGGIIQDIKRRYPQYLSDIKDGLNIQSVATIIFLYLACITPIITLGGILGGATNGYIGTMETLLAAAVVGCIYAVFSAQPLTILGLTGPFLIFEILLYEICNYGSLDYLSFRFWIGLWTFAMLVIILAFDLSVLVKHITRFTEETFSVLVSLIFIWEACARLNDIWKKYPVYFHVKQEITTPTKCRCIPPDVNATTEPVTAIPTAANSTNQTYTFTTSYSNNSAVNSPNWTALMNQDCVTSAKHIVVAEGCMKPQECLDMSYNLTGDACIPETMSYVPDVFFLCCFLFIGSFTIALFFRWFRNSHFLPNIVRHVTSDFAVLIAITICTIIDHCMGLDTPKLIVPSTFQTTNSSRHWLVNPGDVTHWWLPIIAIIPAFLTTVLLFLDQQITAVIVNRKEHRLKKGHGYHLDLAVLALGIFLCTLFGLPWFVAATVRSICHVRSLMMYSELKAPGERMQFLGVREQRVTAFCVSVLLGISVHFGEMLKHIPMPVLYGVLLYMGVTSLLGIQFMQRFDLLLMPLKYQPDFIYLRHLTTKRVHLFTLIQLACLVLLFIISRVFPIYIIFPLMVLLLVYVRRALNYVFTQKELQWLDHIIPCEARREKEDKEKEKEKDEKPKTGFKNKLKQFKANVSHYSESFGKPGDIQMSDISMTDIPTNESKAGVWQSWVAKRDYGLGRQQRPRKRSHAIIEKYEEKKRNLEHEESKIKDTTADSLRDSALEDSRISFRERQFIL